MFRLPMLLLCLLPTIALGGPKDDAIVALQEALNTQDALVESQSSEINALRAAISAKDSQIVNLEGAARMTILEANELRAAINSLERIIEIQTEEQALADLLTQRYADAYDMQVKRTTTARIVRTASGVLIVGGIIAIDQVLD